MSDAVDTVLFWAAMTGLTILGLMILFMGVLAAVYMIKPLIDIVKYGF